jgi:hypothetical protein
MGRQLLKIDSWDSHQRAASRTFSMWEESSFTMSKTIPTLCVGVTFYVGILHDVEVDSDTVRVGVAFHVGRILHDVEVDSDMTCGCDLRWRNPS